MGKILLRPYVIDTRKLKLITTFLMYFLFPRVQFLGLYSFQCTCILLLMLSMTTKFFFYHVYAEDTQLSYFSPSDQIYSLLDKTSTSTNDINVWMSAKKLKMNNGKTEFFSAAQKSVRPNSLKTGNNIFNFSKKLKEKNLV